MTRAGLLLGLVAVATATDAFAQVLPSGTISSTTVKLPDGPGSVGGLAKPAELELFSGQVSYSIPIKVPAVGGLSPSVALSYSGALGNGPAGIGWALGAPAIRRSLRQGVPRYNDSDELTIEGVASGRLVRIAEAAYVVEGAGSTIRVRRFGEYFEVTDGDGTRYYFGHTASARQADSGRVAAWFLQEVVNLAGERMQFTYATDRGEVYLQRVTWGPDERYQLEVRHEPRADVLPSYATGFSVTTARRIDRLRSLVALPGESPREIARYELQYADEDDDPSNDGPLSQLTSVTMTGLRDAGDQLLPGGTLPPVSFTYAVRATPRSWVLDSGGWVLEQRGVALVDIDGDGADDLLRLETGNAAWRKNLGGRFGAAAIFGNANALELTKVRFLDIDGDARPEVVRLVDDQWRAYPLASAALGDGRVLAGTRGVDLGGGSTVLADIDGDGRTDVIEAVTGGITMRRGVPLGLGPPAFLPPINAAEAYIEPGVTGVRFLDANGDGLADVVYLTDAWMKVYLGRGNGTFEPYAKVFYPWGTGAIPLDHIHLVDLDRDGVLDLLRVDAGKVRWFSGLAGFRFERFPRQLDRPPGADSDVRVTFADVDGNGSQDVVWSNLSAMWALDLAGGTTRAMVASIDDGMGEVQHISYGTSTQLSLEAEAAGEPWARKLPRAMAVPVRQETVYADGTPSRVVNAGIRDGFWDGAERRFGGFLVGRTVVPGDTQAQIRVEETTFHAGEGDDRVIRGKPVDQRIRDGLGTLYTVTTSAWFAIRPASLEGALEPDDPLLRRAVMRSQEVANHEGVTTPITTRLEISYDSEARPFEERSHGRRDLCGDERTTWRRYASDDTTWVRDRVIEEELHGGVGRSLDTLVSHTRHYFGNHEGAPLPHGQVGFGWPRKSEGLLWSSGSTPTAPRWVTLSTADYDAHGNVIASTEGPTRAESSMGGGVRRTVDYDADGLFPVRESVEPATGRVLSWTAVWDPLLSVVSWVTTPAGDTTHVEYDAVARVVALRQNGNPAHQRYVYEWSAPRPRTFSYAFERELRSLPTFAEQWNRTDQYVGWKHTVTVADSSGDELFSAGRLGTNQWLISGWNRKDGRGRVTDVLEGFTHNAAALPVAPPESLRRQLLRYDAMDRAYQHELPTGARTTTSFRAFEQTVAVDGLAPVTSTFDGEGRIRRTQRTIDAAVESVDAIYDPAGRILALELQKPLSTDAASCPEVSATVAHRFVYDSFGRLIEADDPDIGLRLMTYDDAGHLTRHVNGAAQGITLGYDLAGRLTSRVADDGTRYDYHYDVDVYGNPTPGYLSFVDEPTGQVRLGYDEFGRNNYVWRQIGSTRLAQDIGIAPSGALYVQRNVRDWSSRYYRDMAGRVIRVAGSQSSGVNTTLWEATSFDPAGRLATERFGNGVVGRYTYDGNGQTERIVVERSAGGERLYDVTLNRNEWGAVTEVSDTDLSELDHDSHFGYDAAGRLTSADIGARTAAGTVSYAFTYRYDGLQNMIDRAATMATPRPLGQHLGVHCYGQSGAGPRQLTSIVTAASGNAAACDSGAPVVASFTYDDAGRQLTDGASQMTYDGLDQLVTVNLPGGVRVDYAYGYDGQRIRTTDNQGSVPEHWFSPDLREVSGVLEQYVKVGDRVISKVKLVDDGVKPKMARAATRARGRDVGVALFAGLALLLGGLGALASCRRRSWRPSLAVLLIAALLLPGCGLLFGSSEAPVWRAEEVRYFHTGFAAGPVLITSDDPVPLVVDERLYEPFGQGLESNREPGGFFDRVDYALESFNVLNKPTDPRTGWSYHGARWMAPQTARWLTPDPPVKAPDKAFMAAPWKLHPYQYVEQNPLIYWDPDGLESVQQRWTREFEAENPGAAGSSLAPGPRDEGIMTPDGIRVPIVPGNMLTPRPFYENRVAAWFAWVGFVHLAELYEAGHNFSHSANRYIAEASAINVDPRDNIIKLENHTRHAVNARIAVAGFQIAFGLLQLRLALLPLYDGKKTTGVLRTANGDIPLVSGYKGPSAELPLGTPGMNGNIKSHVEAHAAAIMRQQGLNEATLYINRVPCPGVRGCDAMLERMLPEGATLHVYGPNGYYKPFKGIPD
jgi:RHS repeat-associated protein